MQKLSSMKFKPKREPEIRPYSKRWARCNASVEWLDG